MRCFRFLSPFILLAALQGATASPLRPGVFFDPQAVSRYRELFRSHPLFAELRKQMDTVDRAREREFLRTGVRYNDHLYDISRVGNLAQQMALSSLFSGDVDAAALATECIESLMKFPRWDYFLEGGSDVVGLQRAPNSAIAVAIVVEVLGDRIPKEVRRRWLSVMAERGTEPSFRATYGMRYPDRVQGWSMDTTSTYFQHRPFDRGLDLSRWPIILNTINLKAIPASALALSALVYRGEFGETGDTRRWLEQASYSVETFREIYSPDGSYNEGISYAHYTTLHLIQAIDALRRGGVADLSDLLNWQGYQEYLLEMTLPTKSDPRAIVNFGDAGPTGAGASVSFWIANHTHDGRASWFGESPLTARDAWAVLYFNPDIHSTPPAGGAHIWKSDLGWLVGRTGYLPEDLIVAMRSGPAFNHEHADRNGLIVKCFGERLVVDPMRPPYSFRDPSWKMRLTAGHSALLIDGKGHQYVDGREGTNASRAVAAVVRSGAREGYFFWTSDASQAYHLVEPDVRSVTRTVVTLTEIPAVIVVDKVIKNQNVSTIQARFFADNMDGRGTVETPEGGFTIARPWASLIGRGVSPSGVRTIAAVPEIPAEKGRLYPYVDVTTIQPAKEICLTTLLLPIQQGVLQPASSLNQNGRGSTIHVSAGGRSATVSIFDSGPVPEFRVETGHTTP